MSDTANRKVLIIDDEYDLGLFLKDFLADLGFEGTIATDTDLGLQLFRDMKPDLVFLDILIPQDGGMECLKAIKKIRPETIVIMITGLQDEGTAKQALSLGAYDYVTKPFDLDMIQTQFIERLFPR